MENGLKVFTNDQFGQIRTINQNGEPWFVAADVCDFFQVTNRNRVMQQVDQADKGGTQMDTPGGKQTVTIINEAGLYDLLFALQPTKARGVSDEYVNERIVQLKAFKRWITHEVIPAIRKHGVYATPDTLEKMLEDPDSMIRVLQSLKEERAARLEAEAKNRANAPKVLFADSVAQAESDILIGELAKLLKQNGVETGQNRLYDRLRKDGYIMKNSTIPTQKAMEAGLFRVIERTIAQPNGTTRITATTKVTGKGQIYFVNKYAKKVEQ